MSQTEKAMYWIEHVMKHKGAKHLRSPASSMPLYKYYLLDVAAFIGFILSVAILISWLILKICFRVVMGKCFKKTDSKMKIN